MTVRRVPMRNKVALNSFLPNKQRGIPMTMRIMPHNQEKVFIQAQRALRE